MVLCLHFTSGTIIRAGMCGNIVSLGVVALVAVMEHDILFSLPLVFRTDTLKSMYRPGSRRLWRITLAWHTELYRVHGSVSTETSDRPVSPVINKLYI